MLSSVALACLRSIARAAHRDRIVRHRRSRSTVAVPVPLRLSLTSQTDGRRDGQHPSNAVALRPSTGLDGIGRESPNKPYLFFVSTRQLAPLPLNTVQSTYWPYFISKPWVMP